MFKKIVAAGLLVGALGAPTSTVAWAGWPFWCTTGERMGDLRAGMTKDQVIAVLGRPDGFSGIGADYQVILSSGVVTAYGPGIVRQNSAPGNVRTLVLIPIR